jgi:hypothetical protein
LIEIAGQTVNWDEEKNRANIKKHGISFYEAATVFKDENALYIPDDKHSDHEERVIVLGLSKNLNLLLVCHCYRNGDSMIRIISARKANKEESKQYGR